MVKVCCAIRDICWQKYQCVKTIGNFETVRQHVGGSSEHSIIMHCSRIKFHLTCTQSGMNTCMKPRVVYSYVILLGQFITWLVIYVCTKDRMQDAALANQDHIEI
jgi:hypothetical protein